MLPVCHYQMKRYKSLKRMALLVDKKSSMHSAEEGWASFCTCNQQSEKLWTFDFPRSSWKSKVITIDLV